MHGYDRNCKGSQDAKVSAHPIPREEQSLIEALKLFVETSRLRVSQVARLIGVGDIVKMAQRSLSTESKKDFRDRKLSSLSWEK
jgi:hypothetical protein